MSHPSSHSVERRGFLVRLSQATAAFTAFLADPTRLDAHSAAVLAGSADPDAWISRLKGQHKVMIHAHQYFMTALVDARNMLANARDSWSVPEDQYSIAVVTHGVAIQGLFRDEVWQRKSLGEFYKVNDPRTGAPAGRNFYLTSQDGEPPDAAVSPLMQRGVVFLVCNVALKNLAKRLSAGGGNADATHDELAAGLVDGVVLVPDVFVAMQRAQKRGVGYIFTDRSR
jgi:intracellular sulfur oxidation DsrE/DsrF family protein